MSNDSPSTLPKYLPFLDSAISVAKVGGFALAGLMAVLALCSVAAICTDHERLASVLVIGSMLAGSSGIVMGCSYAVMRGIRGQGRAFHDSASYFRKHLENVEDAGQQQLRLIYGAADDLSSRRTGNGHHHAR